MQKKLFFILVFVGLGYFANAQLTDTKWKGTLNVPTPEECIMHFKKDTVMILVAADQSIIVETMTYTLKNDSLTLTKVSGTSPCTDVKALYKCQLKEGKLYISPINDECPERANAFNPEAWIKEN